MVLYLWMILQIICESLPISSSGHICLQQKMIPNHYHLSSYAAVDLCAFDYLLQGLSATIIFCYFFQYWWQLIVQNNIVFSSLLQADLWIKRVPAVFIFGGIADAITFLFWKCICFEKVGFFLFSDWYLAFGFLMTAIALWSLQYTTEKKDINIWDWRNGCVVGLAQAIALYPGISRFGLTITALQWRGYNRLQAFYISFLLQFPLILAGALYGFFMLENQEMLQIIVSWQFLILFMFVAVLSYRLLQLVGKIIEKNLLWKFSYYMIIPIFLALYF